MEKNKKVWEIAHSLDNELGGILLKLEDLKAIDTNLGHVMENMDNTDQLDLKSMGMTLRDVYPTLKMIESLLRYSVKDLSEYYEQSNDLKQILFNELRQIDEKEKTLEPGQEQR